MKRLVYLTMATLTALVILVPTVAAQEMMDESKTMEQQPKMMDDSMMEQSKMEQGKMEKGKMAMPNTGGPSLGLLLLPAAALLAGMGLMAGYVVRRRT